MFLVESLRNRQKVGSQMDSRQKTWDYPVIMVQWKITLNERKLILEGSIFHFHDDGRKGRSGIQNLAVLMCIIFCPLVF